MKVTGVGLWSTAHNKSEQLMHVISALEMVEAEASPASLDIRVSK